MKAKNSAFAAIITLAAVAIGFFMPGVICGISDNRREAQVMNHESESVKLVFADTVSLADKLMLIKNGHSRVALETGKTLDKSGAQKAAVAVVTWLRENGFYAGVEFAAADFTCEPFVLTSGDNAALSAIFWECDAQDNYGNLIKMLIDDESGKMMAFTNARVKDDSDKTITTYVLKNGGADRFANLCLTYYGFSKLDISSTSSNGYSDESVFIFTDKDGKSCAVSCALAKSFFIFNS